MVAMTVIGVIVIVMTQYCTHPDFLVDFDFVAAALSQTRLFPRGHNLGRLNQLTGFVGPVVLGERNYSRNIGIA